MLAQITGSIFEYLGYKVEFSQATTNEQWGALYHGVDHVQVEVWQGTMGKMFDKLIATRQVLDAGSHDATTREDWWYPLYVEKQCPGLPDWRALKHCAAIFNNKPNASAGRLVAVPWEQQESARIRALALNFTVDEVADTHQLWHELEKAVKVQKPIIIFNWTPNWIAQKYPGRFVEFPEYDVKCESEPSWGVNPKFNYDCGNIKKGWLKKLAWSGMAQRWPCAFKTLLNINVDNKTIENIAAWVEYHNMTTTAAASKWIKENQAQWKSWIPDTCQQQR